ncbi:phospho-N-acetylmuramoyl-pentapeptide-transferase [candidate division NPL-UPA2 bacterium]|nr:phospho-N-acetylmuramoyl-pentapeptide-transferase [candidate division NPL-UPA2 bacterium]
MFYHLYPVLREFFSPFNVLRYITFRAALAAVTALFLSLILGPLVIRKLSKFKVGERIGKEACPELRALHRDKEGTPTMGGVLILLSLLLSTLLWTDLSNRFILLILGSTVWLGILGFIDDRIKLAEERSGGLRVATKLTGQLGLGLLIGLYLYYHPLHLEHGTEIAFPFFKNLFLPLGWLYIPFVMLVIVATSNAVNLTDGLDGLAIGCVAVAAAAYAGISYVSGHIGFSEHLNIVYIVGSGELSIFCAAVVGAGLGFLWFNSYPARVFMGDTGSLALGGALGVVAIVIKHEILLLVVGGVFVLEALSVIIQVVSYRLRKKRVFMVAPLHHHFELRGWAEPKVIVRFWILAVILALLSLSTLKLR